MPPPPLVLPVRYSPPRFAFASLGSQPPIGAFSVPVSAPWITGASSLHFRDFLLLSGRVTPQTSGQMMIGFRKGLLIASAGLSSSEKNQGGFSCNWLNPILPVGKGS